MVPIDAYVDSMLTLSLAASSCLAKLTCSRLLGFIVHPIAVKTNSMFLFLQGIAHRDIKPENVLFSADMTLKVADFGLAIHLREEHAVTRVGESEGIDVLTVCHGGRSYCHLTSQTLMILKMLFKSQAYEGLYANVMGGFQW